MADSAELVHATAIALGGRAALIRGSSGSGKSDLALRCLSAGPSQLFPVPARLVSDDQVCLTRRENGLYASAPATIAGKIEVRGFGIVTLPQEAVAPGETEAVLAVELVGTPFVERLPDPWPRTSFLGVGLPVLRLDPAAPSAHLALLLALSQPLPGQQS